MLEDFYIRCKRVGIFDASKKCTFFENKIGWHFLHEDGVYYLYKYCTQKNLNIFMTIHKEVHESIYWHATGRNCNCWNVVLHDILGCAPAIILTTCFCKLYIFLLLQVLLPKNNFIFYNIFLLLFLLSIKFITVKITHWIQKQSNEI